jgi:hypothetical protein
MSKKLFGLFVLLMISTTVFAQEAAPTPPPAEPTVAAAPAEGGTIPLVDRALVLAPGKMAAGFDFTIGLNKDPAIKDMFMKSANLADHYDGLTFSYGVMENLEAGIGINALSYAKDRKNVEGDDKAMAFGGFALYGKYAIMPMLAAELQVFAPGWSSQSKTLDNPFNNPYVDKFGDQLVGVDIGIPFQYVAMPGMLLIHARPDFNISFAKKEEAGEATPMWITFDAGATFNATPELFFDLSLGLVYIMKSDLKETALKMDLPETALKMDLPLSITAGYTVMPALDVYLAFQINDLLADKDKEEGELFDTKSIGLGCDYRF